MGAGTHPAYTPSAAKDVNAASYRTQYSLPFAALAPAVPVARVVRGLLTEPYAAFPAAPAACSAS
jgi:hypothetical protein